MSIALLLLLTQNPATPTIPPGLNEAFVTTCYAVEQALASSDFAAAAQLVANLPKTSATVSLSMEGVPTQRRAAIREQLGYVIEQARPMIDLEVADQGPADIAISFVSHLPPKPPATLPAGAALVFAQSQPRVRESISLTRGIPAQVATVNDVHNEIAFAVAEYVGLERVPSFGSFSTRSDQSTIQSVALSEPETDLGKKAIQVSDALRSLVSARTKIQATAPAISTSVDEIDGVKGLQDVPLQVELNVTNRGTSDLQLYAIPDCSCLSPYVADPDKPGETTNSLKPGQTTSVVASVNTALFHTGYLNHEIMIYSNDPKRPVVVIPVHMDVEPLYRFVQSGPQIAPAGSGGAEFDVYLVLADPMNLSVLVADLHGMHGSVSFAPWKGEIPNDASKGEVHGFKFHIHMDPIKYPGQFPVNLVVGTDSDAFRELNYTFQVQNGIVAMPGQYDFGSVPQEPMTFSVLLTNPISGFHITAIRSGSPYLAAKAVSLNGDREYRIDVQYDGKSGYGKFVSTMEIHTDDPKQPMIRIPISGTVQ